MSRMLLHWVCPHVVFLPRGFYSISFVLLRFFVFFMFNVVNNHGEHVSCEYEPTGRLLNFVLFFLLLLLLIMSALPYHACNVCLNAHAYCSIARIHLYHNAYTTYVITQRAYNVCRNTRQNTHKRAHNVCRNSHTNCGVMRKQVVP